MNDYNRAVAQRLLDQISGFSSALRSLEELQFLLSGFVTLFENDGSGLAGELDQSIQSLEEARFSVGSEEQAFVGVKILEDLRRAVEEAVDR